MNTDSIEDLQLPGNVIEDVDENRDEIDFINGIMLDDVTTPTQNLNIILNKLFKKVMDEIPGKLAESVILSIPKLVANQVAQQEELKKLSKKFYEDNKDLVGSEGIVAMTVNKIYSDHPDWKLNEVLDKAKADVRETIKLKSTASQRKKSNLGDLSNSIKKI